MVYIRAKKIKSDYYLYLVKSVWDSKKRTSKQEIIKYLGKASKVIKDDIPKEYRNSLRVSSILASYNPKDVKKREDEIREARQQLYKKLTGGDIQECIKIYEGHVKTSTPSSFFDKILKPTMHEIGDDWANQKISIATEHVASNVAQTLVKIIMDQVTRTDKKKKVLICVPLGEEHNLGCGVLETYLSIKGFNVYNMGAPIPTEDILSFISNNKPDVVLISITLPDNIGAGQRLVRKIKTKYDIPILVGGYAVQIEKPANFGCTVIKDVGLEKVPKLLQKAQPV